MGIRIRENLGGIVSSLGQQSSPSAFKFRVGRVYAVVMDETTPSSEVFDKFGGWDGMGTAFYMEYEQSKNIPVTNENFINYAINNPAKPFFPNQKFYPLLGELILIFNLPSPDSQNREGTSQDYYISVLNLWNSNHHNAQTSTDSRLGSSFNENADLKPVRAFEGDYILEGRFGQALRFGSTTKINSSENFWSKTGKDGDPITIVSNGHKSNSKFLSPYVENINTDDSALYLTSTQQLPLKVSKTKLNPLSGTTLPETYMGAQALLTSDRVVINARKENVLLFATNNIELYTKNTLSIDTDEKVVINSPQIFLGLNNDNIPTEPAILGNEMVIVLTKLLNELGKFSDSLSTAVVSGVGPISDINVAATSLGETVDSVLTSLSNKVRSSKVRIAK
jgi:hypothetical protein